MTSHTNAVNVNGRPEQSESVLRCCDGGFVVTETGLVVRSMVKFGEVTMHNWANHGTRHDAAFAIASAGGVHLITAASARAGKVYELR